MVVLGKAVGFVADVLQQPETRAVRVGAEGLGAPGDPEVVALVFREADGMIHGFLNFRQAIPSATDDFLGCIAQLRGMIAEAAA